MKPSEVGILCIIIRHSKEASKVNSNENSFCPTGLNRIISRSRKYVLPRYRSGDYRISALKTVIINSAEFISLMDA